MGGRKARVSPMGYNQNKNAPFNAKGFCSENRAECPYKKECRKKQGKSNSIPLETFYKFGAPNKTDKPIVQEYKRLPENKEQLCILALRNSVESRQKELPSYKTMKASIERRNYMPGIGDLSMRRIVLQSLYEEA